MNDGKVDYRKILKRYIDYVGCVEGTDFLGSDTCAPRDFFGLKPELSDAEMAALWQVRDEVRAEEIRRRSPAVTSEPAKTDEGR